ncbi:IS1341-type transposase (TCE32) [Halorubrum saccharovorum DSM 1137]|uniref:IS1341-type transposase (TCE32) n=1 Tax=Halorubrum saccharovorum DSM 1137 TaxID=1227484 RepID=M0DTD3_9EURY|nr:IS200/IS605 family transposon protein TnpB [Halorubrum saccharovorum]ELZ38771.1 IS1341-type transposase (TCE32) [Halorubrum saccharovorum DSM 1137]
MRRTNTFVVRPRSEQDAELLHELLDASASLWNELTYERRQNYFDGKSVWDTADYRQRYVGVLGSATAQQLIRKNKSAWRSFFSLKEKGEKCSPPGYWGNEEDGRTLRTYVRNDQYTLEMGDRSRLEIPVGKELKEEYGLGHTERLRLEVAGVPKWDGKHGRLELYYDESSDQFRAFQPVTIDTSRLDTPLASEEAALDIGANNLAACTTTTGQQYLYHGRDLFDQFRDTTREIARLQSKLPEGRYSSNRIRQLYGGRTRRRDHAQNALVRDLLERLYNEGVSTVYVGDLTDVLETHWSVRANQKTHNFWAFRAFLDRLACTAEEYDITVEVRSEAWTSQTCPNCGSTTDTTRHQDTLTCSCGFEGHADLVASESFLRRHTDVPRPMARPVRFEWDSHEWLESPRSHRPKEVRTDQSIHG